MDEPRALTPDELAEYGIDVDVVDGYETRSSNAARPFNPVGFMVHHTAGTDSLGTITRNALANYHIDKDGTITLVALGRTAHPGFGAQSVIDDCRNDIPPAGDASRWSPRAVDPTRHLDPDGERVAGYEHFVGVEVENRGDGKDPYPDVQIDAMISLAAAHCIHWNWTPARVIHHREFTSRKIDMSWYGDLRGSVAAAMSFNPTETIVALQAEAQAALDAGFWNGANPTSPITREHASIIAWRAHQSARRIASEDHDALAATVAELRAEIETLKASGSGPARVEFPTSIPVDVTVKVTGE